MQCSPVVPAQPAMVHVLLIPLSGQFTSLPSPAHPEHQTHSNGLPGSTAPTLEWCHIPIIVCMLVRILSRNRTNETHMSKGTVIRLDYMVGLGSPAMAAYSLERPRTLQLPSPDVSSPNLVQKARRTPGELPVFSPHWEAEEAGF